MKLIAPPFQKGQGFGENANGSYHAAGMDGHPAIDYGGSGDWGKAIPNAIEGAVVSALLSKDNPNLEAYRAVNTIFDDGENGCYEIQYGHVLGMNVKVGDTLKVGQGLAALGNTGEVYGGNPLRLITDEEKKAGSHAGAHVHFQVRLIKKVPINDASYAHYLNDGSGRLVLKGFSYAIPNFDNGYNGCVDPTQFFNAPHFMFMKDLYLGMSDPDVLELQKRLGIDYSTAPGLFGPRTFAAVRSYQMVHNIPTTGYVGPVTRASLNQYT